MTLAAKPLDLTIYQTRDSALVEACRVAKQSHNKRATLWYRGYRTYLVTEYCERDEQAAEALRIVFPNGTWLDAQQLAKQGHKVLSSFRPGIDPCFLGNWQNVDTGGLTCLTR